jgi:hypothetical protein
METNQRTVQRGRPFPVGTSGNPTGMTRTERRTAEFLTQFRERHGREPAAGEAVQIRLAGKLSAKLENPRARSGAEDFSPLVGHLCRTLRHLGLAPAKPPSPRIERAFRAKQVVEEVKEAAAGPAQRVLSRFEQVRKERAARPSALAVLNRGAVE